MVRGHTCPRKGREERRKNGGKKEKTEKEKEKEREREREREREKETKFELRNLELGDFSRFVF